MARKKQKRTYHYLRPEASSEQQLRIQKMREELNAPDPNDPHVFTRYKKITYPFVVLFPRMRCTASGAKSPNSTPGKRWCRPLFAC